MSAGPALRVLEQRTADAVAVVAWRDREVGHMARACASEKVALQLQVQETGAPAVRVRGHEKAVAGCGVAQRVFKVGADRGQHVALAPSSGQVERYEARHQRQDEFRVAGLGWADACGMFALLWHDAMISIMPSFRGSPEGLNPEPILMLLEARIKMDSGSPLRGVRSDENKGSRS